MFHLEPIPISLKVIVDWVGIRKRELADRMGEDRLAKVTKECHPQGVRSRGTPKKDG